jgi:ornithine carbamoyltransferase
MINRNRHLLRINDWNEDRILETVAIAMRLKKEINEGKPSDRFRGQTIGMFFEKPSLRTITTFQVGIHQLGGMPVLLAPDSIGLGKRESVQDVARCLSRWVNALVVRCFKQELVEQLAEHGSIPVINALTDDFHPCQALAFAQMMTEQYGSLKGKTVAFIGDGNNVANSLLTLAAKVGMNFTLACPRGFEQPQSVVNESLEGLKKHGTKYRVFNNPEEAVKDADILYSDVWVSMGQEMRRTANRATSCPSRLMILYSVKRRLTAK